MFPWSDISLGYNCANRVRLNIQEAICWSRNGESGNGTRRMMGTQGIRVGTWGIRVGKQGIRVGMWGIKVGMQGMAWEWWKCRECGEWVGNAGNQGENAGNHGDSSWESSCLSLRLKSRSVRGAFHPPGVMGSWPTISHTPFALSTKWMSSSSRKWGLGFSPRFHLLVFVFGVNQEN